VITIEVWYGTPHFLVLHKIKIHMLFFTMLFEVLEPRDILTLHGVLGVVRRKLQRSGNVKKERALLR